MSPLRLNESTLIIKNKISIKLGTTTTTKQNKKKNSEIRIEWNNTW